MSEIVQLEILRRENLQLRMVAMALKAALDHAVQAVHWHHAMEFENESGVPLSLHLYMIDHLPIIKDMNEGPVR